MARWQTTSCAGLIPDVCKGLHRCRCREKTLPKAASYNLHLYRKQAGLSGLCQGLQPGNNKPEAPLLMEQIGGHSDWSAWRHQNGGKLPMWWDIGLRRRPAQGIQQVKRQPEPDLGHNLRGDLQPDLRILSVQGQTLHVRHQRTQ